MQIRIFSCWVGGLLLLSLAATAQPDQLFIENFLFNTRGGFSNFSVPTAVSKVGGPTTEASFHFLQEEWTTANVLSWKDEQGSALARYDVRGDQIVLNLDGGYAQLMPAKAKAIAMGQLLMVPESYTEGNQLKTGWFELLANGPVKLLKRYRLESRKADLQPGRLSDPTNITWIVVQDVYGKDGGNPAKKLKLGKKHVLALFGTHAYKVEQFAKENKLGFTKTEDLTAIFKYFTQLTQIKQG